jgi:UTP--glucose-1-phosphate uridylyltransferase
MSRAIKKAVFPVAGLGTRLLPATKALPKEMLTIVDRPVIQLAVDEAREAGIEHFIFVTGRNKAIIEDHFDVAYELEATLRERGKTQALNALRADLPAAGETSFTRQQTPLGLGHAVWCARELVGDEPFAVILPDMIMQSSPGCLSQMVDAYHAVGGGNVIAVEEVPWNQVSKYGVVGYKGGDTSGNQIVEMVEKPAQDQAPSNHIISGRYILQPEIFDILAGQKPGAGGEIQLTDAMITLMSAQPFWSHHFQGTTFDCGDRLGFLLANVVYGLANGEVGGNFRKALTEILQLHGEMPDMPSVTSHDPSSLGNKNRPGLLS